jgi:SlyX protein
MAGAAATLASCALDRQPNDKPDEGFVEISVLMGPTTGVKTHPQAPWALPAADWVATGGQPRVPSARLPFVNDSRLTEVEVRYSYLERLVRDLSSVLHEQQRLIDAISIRLERVESLVAEAVSQPHERHPYEKPPHY